MSSERLSLPPVARSWGVATVLAGKRDLGDAKAEALAHALRQPERLKKPKIVLRLYLRSMEGLKDVILRSNCL